MTGVAKDWLIVIAFFAGFLAFTLAETAFVKKRTGTGLTRSLLFTFVSNTLAITFGLFVSFVVFMGITLFVWDRSLENIEGNHFTVWVAVIFATMFPLVVLIAAKRVLIKTMNLDVAPGPWAYAVLSSLAFYLVLAAVIVLSAMLL